MKLLAVVAATAATVACGSVSQPAPNTMSRIVESWQGEPIAAVTRYWGQPTGQARQDSHTVYEWQTDHSFYLPSVSANSVEQRFTLHCVRQLTVNEQGIVTRGAWRGDLCCSATLAGGCANWERPVPK